MRTRETAFLLAVCAACLASAAEPAHTNRVEASPGTAWMDRTHVRWGERLDRTASWLDTRFSAPGVGTGQTASCSAVLGAEVGVERGEALTVRARGRAHVDLPRMEDRLRLTLDNVRRDALPGRDPIETERDLKLGLDWYLYRTLRSLFDLEAGVKFKPSPKPFVDLRLDHRRNLDGWSMAFRQSEFWNPDDRFAELTALTFQRRLGEAWMLRSTTAGRWGQETVGLESEQTFAFARRFGEGRRQASLAASAFAERYDISSCRLRFTWRSRILRPWYSVYVVPELNFPAEERFAGKPSVRIGFEIAYD
jgi:hypothetical protein